MRYARIRYARNAYSIVWHCLPWKPRLCCLLFLVNFMLTKMEPRGYIPGVFNGLFLKLSKSKWLFPFVKNIKNFHLVTGRRLLPHSYAFFYKNWTRNCEKRQGNDCVAFNFSYGFKLGGDKFVRQECGRVVRPSTSDHAVKLKLPTLSLVMS